MKIRFFGTYRRITGQTEIDWNSNAQTVKELIDELSRVYGEKLKDRIMADPDKLSNDVIILINGKSESFMEKANTRIKMDDQISIFPMAFGG